MQKDCRITGKRGKHFQELRVDLFFFPEIDDNVDRATEPCTERDALFNSEA